MKQITFQAKQILKGSILEAFYTLWTAPINEPKLKLPDAKKAAGDLFFGNLILGQKS